MKARALLEAFTSGLLITGMILPASSQVTSDGTNNTLVNQNGNNFTILNGIEKGNNLFHSFSNFSVPTGGSAIFDLINTPNITTIFSRVIGGNVSDINGLIQTLNGNHPVSLFLMNPAGIVFRENAKLDIGGSFVGTTANSIKFSDGVEFSAVNPTATPLLTISVPIGLQMGQTPLAIAVQGTGHSLTNPNPGGQPPILVAPSATELQVQSGKTLALVGGNLYLNGATLTANQGQIELGSLSGAGLVSLIPTAQGYTLGYENGQSFGDIQLAQKSLLNISGVNAGSVQIQGRQIEFTDGSLILAQNYGHLPGGDIRLQASAAIDMIGTTNDGTLSSGVRSEAFGMGASGNISVVTPVLTVQQGAGLNNIAVGNAPSGNIQIDANKIEVSGFSLINPIRVSNITTLSYAAGSAGDVIANGNSLLVSGGASLSSVIFDSGSSGKVTIHNNNTTVMGQSPFGLYSAISLITFATGNTKDLILDTTKLQVLDGGTIGSSAFLVGNGGNVNINASEAIAISGGSSNNNSSINSSVIRLTPQLRQLLGVPDILTANAGNLSITTPNLLLTNGGTVSVTSQGSGNGGSLDIIANTIRLDRKGNIQAQTESGNGGNIALQVGKLLLLHHNSAIAATAGGNGNGGNININAPIIVGLENSDIIANAVQGRGGNIQIATQGIFELKYGNQLTDNSDITASSQFGVNGTVNINNFGVDPSSGLVELPVKLTDPSQQIAAGCSQTNASSFVATGRGGIPQNPTEEIGSNHPWSDIRDITAYRNPSAVTVQIPESDEVLLQATGWHRRADGKIELFAAPSPTVVQQHLTCAAVPKT